ncbi:AraC family transcriptional regulator [Microvirga sp. ACRRW]|uniref:AraC family transcriptional regulator n=1 Tax=Microvirga sp. ACRRW TaxID=2918205 RepID=UPI001EF5433B|nr:AraC family transcriptional regulator [Microvirga sp. ACRRW]MCG7392851.1 AraC family transcriptional regulator [Microvirga sp. ACRRW]
MALESTLIAKIDETRRAQGFLEIEAVLALGERGNTILDPFSTLIAKHARIGANNIFYPGVTIHCSSASELTIGDGNTFYAGTWLAADAGTLTIGNGNLFGEGGGFTAKADRAGVRITIGDQGRYQGGASVFGETFLGSGSQLLGMITVDSCYLAAGGSFRDPDPDARAALLKGQGVARKLRLDVGQVISTRDDFTMGDVKPQSFFHPKVPRS